MQQTNYGGLAGPGALTTQSFKEVLASTVWQIKLPGGIMLAQGNGVIEKGTVLGIVTASGLGVPYNAAANDGSQVPVCILDNDQDTTLSNMPASGWIAGIFLAAQCIGVDANVKTTLNLCKFY